MIFRKRRRNSVNTLPLVLLLKSVSCVPPYKFPPVTRIPMPNPIYSKNKPRQDKNKQQTSTNNPLTCCKNSLVLPLVKLSTCIPPPYKLAPVMKIPMPHPIIVCPGFCDDGPIWREAVCGPSEGGRVAGDRTQCAEHREHGMGICYAGPVRRAAICGIGEGG